MGTDVQQEHDALIAPRTGRDALALCGLAILFSVIGLLALLSLTPP